jgi:hypothetical protein
VQLSLNKERTMERRGLTSLGRVLAGSLCLLLPSCGSDSSSPAAPPAPTPVPCTEQLLDQGTGAIPALSLGRRPFSVPTAGRLDITLDWTFAASPVFGYLVAAGTCPIASFNANGCTFLARSENAVKPRRMSVQSVAPGNYELLAVNFADVQESLASQVVLKMGNCPAFASTGPALLAATRGAGPFGTLERVTDQN